MFEIDVELWAELSAVEQEREIYLASQEYAELVRVLSSAQRLAKRRRAELNVARAYRAAFREVQIEPFYEGLKRSQARLLKLRIERSTGITLGQA